jgi:hypothetical protein
MKRIFHLVVMTVIVFSITFTFVWTLNQAPVFAGGCFSKTSKVENCAETQQQPQQQTQQQPQQQPQQPPQQQPQQPQRSTTRHQTTNNP